MDKPIPTYEKLFSRDFALPSVEAWVRGETTNPKGWTKENQPSLPYIVFERSDDTIHAWYDLQGVEWITDLLSQLAHEDGTFIERVNTEVLKRLDYLRPIYEEEHILALPELKKFITELEAGYPWFEAMWWFCQMDEKKLVGLGLENIKKTRMLSDKLSNGSDTVIRKSLVALYPNLGDLSSVILSTEIATGQIPLLPQLEKRYAGYFYANEELIVGSTKGEISNRFAIRFQDEVSMGSVNEIVGTPAYKGIVRGRVRRVMGHKQFNEMQEGEILVSPMTMPDFLPVMKKAAAIVTDEGGIVCHAAIVARELKKPCITGTKVATQILKTGDLVEIDANQGIVRKIS